MAVSCGIFDELVQRTPVAVVDFETTGLTAGPDRVIEVSVVRLEPGHEPQVVLDTLVCPNRPVAATEIHGITDADVADAPTFADIAGDLVRAMSGCVIGAYNVYFDIRFLRYELHAAGLQLHCPYLCLMYMRPLLNLGSRCSLNDACRDLGIYQEVAHLASSDALAAARLWPIYLDAMRRQKLQTFGDLAARKSYKFFESFVDPPFDAATAPPVKSATRMKSRGETPLAHEEKDTEEMDTGSFSSPARRTRREYWEAMKSVLADLVITDDEVAYLARKQEELGLEIEQIRSLHARAFAQVIFDFTDDRWLDDREAATLHRLHRCFSRLGWAPGEPESGQSR